MRLFVATLINSEVEQELTRLIGLLKDASLGVKWVAPSNIHLTLKFLGDVNEKLFPDLKRIINETAGKFNTVDTVLNGLGAFPNLNRARVYWVGLSGGKDNLISIATELENKFNKLGFEKENRQFKAHLTLGRVKSPEGLQKLNKTIKTIQVEQIQFKFDKIVLFKSTLTPRGPIYQSLHQAELRQ